MTLRIPPLFQLALAGCVGWFLSETFPLLSYVSRIVWIAGWVSIAAGIVVLLIAVGVFRQIQTTVNPITPEKTNGLVTTGLYGLSRNPMYVGMAAALTGAALLLQNYAALVSVPLFLLSITSLQILPEEKVLAEKFGDDFEHYRETTARWL